MTVRILLVDDSESDVYLTETALERVPQATELAIAGDGAEALAILHAPDAALPDLMLLDISMPVMDGFEVLVALRSDERTRRAPVVLMWSSSSSPLDRQKAMSLGADAFVTKPSTFEALVQTLADSVSAVSKASGC